jgi:ferredoxin--NADP+ reductase
VREPETYERFDRVVLAHGCRQVAELAYGERTVKQLAGHEFLGEMVRRQLIYYPTVTREPFPNRGRVTDLLASGELSFGAGLSPVDPAVDRFMLCGSPAMLAELKIYLVGQGMAEGNSGEPADFVIERAFVER